MDSHYKCIADALLMSTHNICFHAAIRYNKHFLIKTDFVCVEVLRPSQPNEVMSSVVSLPNHTFTGQA